MIIASKDNVLNVSPARVDALREYIAGEKRWFHCFEFNDGLTTPGYDPSAKKLHHLMLPSRLDGLSVLDIGAYDGYFSFHAKARGAARVVACDDFVWRLDNVPARTNLHTVRTALDLHVEDVVCAAERLPEVFKDPFDITLFLGVLYHAPDMLQYLHSVFAVTKTVCVIETLVDNLDVNGPSAAYYPKGVLNGDDSNNWGPNISAVIGMCQRVGFSHVEFGSMWHLNTRDCIDGKGDMGAVRSGRVVFYAYR